MTSGLENYMHVHLAHEPKEGIPRTECTEWQEDYKITMSEKIVVVSTRVIINI